MSRVVRRTVVLLVATAAMACAQPAAAHELTVLDAGSAELDAGDARVPRLVHATLPKFRQALTITLRPRDVAARVQLLVPAGDSAAADEPRMQVSAGGGEVRLLDTPRRLVDDVTGVAYLLVGSARIPATGAQATVTIHRGTGSPLVAVRVGGPSPFRTDDPRRTPQALAALRAWADAARGTSRTAASGTARAQVQAAPWFGAAIALLAVGVAAWWGVRGRSSARAGGRAGGRAD